MSSPWLAAVALAAPTEDDISRESVAARIRAARLVAVLDANALIHGVRPSVLLQPPSSPAPTLDSASPSSMEVASVTVPEVLAEIRDESTRRALAAAEGEGGGLATLEPDESAVRAVMNVARSTGDLAVLSGPDVRLLALTYMLEVERNGNKFARTEVMQPKVLDKQSKQRALPGWGEVANPEDWAEIDKLDDAAGNADATSRVLTNENPLEDAEAAADYVTQEEAGLMVENGGGARARKPVPNGVHGRIVTDEEVVGATDWEKSSSKKAIARRKKREERAKAAASAAEKVAQLNIGESQGGHGPAESEEEGGGEAGKTGGGEKGAPEEGEDEARGESSVSIFTHDFPMQNVALHMGLRLVTMNGMRVKSKEFYALKCTACFAICRNSTKIFCPKCGNQSLVKVTVSIGEDGVEHFGMSKRQNLRGTRYSLPQPKGGRNSSDVITSEDQLKEVSRKMKGGGYSKMVKDTILADAELLEGLSGSDAEASLPATLMSSGILSGGRQNPNERKVHKKRR